MADAIRTQIASCRGGDPAGFSRSGARRESRLPWPLANDLPPGETWVDFSRSTFWRLSEYLDELGSPKDPHRRHCVAIRAARIALLDVAFEREAGELTDLLELSVRSIERGRALLRDVYEHRGAPPEPRPVPREPVPC